MAGVGMICLENSPRFLLVPCSGTNGGEVEVCARRYRGVVGSRPSLVVLRVNGTNVFWKTAPFCTWLHMKHALDACEIFQDKSQEVHAVVVKVDRNQILSVTVHSRAGVEG